MEIFNKDYFDEELFAPGFEEGDFDPDFDIIEKLKKKRKIKGLKKIEIYVAS